MPAWFYPLFIAIDLAITAIVVVVMIRRRGGVAGLMNMNLAQLATIGREMEHESEEYLRSNWSGDPDTLGEPMAVLLQRFEEKTRAAGVEVDRESLKPMLVSLVAAKHLAKPDEAEEALRQVA